MKAKLISEIANLIDNDCIRKAYQLARENDITITDIWEDDELIGLSVEGKVIYF